VTLTVSQSQDCAKTCRGGATTDFFLLDYNIENGGNKDAEKGKLDSVVSVFLHPAVANIDSPNANAQIRKAAQGSGVYIDGSYGATSDRKTKTVSGLVSGPVKTDPNAGYHLQYLLDVDLATEGPGAAATQWMYRAKLTPYFVYVTK
jgi:hypothetical protein